MTSTAEEEYEREEALAELREIAEHSNNVRHRFQMLNPVWKGRPLSEVLKELADVLEDDASES